MERIDRYSIEIRDDDTGRWELEQDVPVLHSSLTETTTWFWFFHKSRTYAVNAEEHANHGRAKAVVIARGWAPQQVRIVEHRIDDEGWKWDHTVWQDGEWLE